MTAETVWDELPPPQDLGEGGETLPPDRSPEDGPECPTCGKPIIRDPSWKRMHKYHDGCQPTGNTGGTRPDRRVSTGKKEEKEADRCEQLLKSFLIKLALGVSVVDRYDAACIMMNANSLCASFRATCLKYPDLRKEFLKVPEGGSVFSLVLAVAMTVLPMAAHHGLIQSKRVAPILANLPFMMYKLQDRLSQGEAGIKSLMQEQMEELKRAKDEAAVKARRDANGQHIPAS